MVLLNFFKKLPLLFFIILLLSGCLLFSQESKQTSEESLKGTARDINKMAEMVTEQVEYEITRKTNEKTENYYDFSLGLFLIFSHNTDGLDLGFGLSITSPYFFYNIFAAYLEGVFLVVNSKFRHPSEPIAHSDYKLYQIYGNIRSGFVVAFTIDRFRPYMKGGPTLILLRDKTWDDYFNVLNNTPKIHDDGTDAIWGFHFLAGFEILLSRHFSIYFEIGAEYLFGTLTPREKSGEDDYIFALDERDFSINYIIGSKFYF